MKQDKVVGWPYQWRPMRWTPFFKAVLFGFLTAGEVGGFLVCPDIIVLACGTSGWLFATCHLL